jgi:hypothetical protein
VLGKRVERELFQSFCMCFVQKGHDPHETLALEQTSFS